MAIDPQTYLVAFGAIILIAFGGSVLFNRTKISDVILLLILGVVLGPLFPAIGAPWGPVLPPELFRGVMPLLGAVAIIVILFDGGLKLNVRDLFVGLAPATLLTTLGFLASVLLTAGVLVTFGIVEDIYVGLILGAIVGGTSSVVVMPVIEKMTVSRNTRTIIGLESALTDVLVVVLAVSLSLAYSLVREQGNPGAVPQSLAQGIAAQFAIGIGLGIAAGYLWANHMRRYAKRTYEYMLTLALLFLLYALTEFFGGSGPLSVLAFGIIMGNTNRERRLEGEELDDARRAHKRAIKATPVFDLSLVGLHNEVVFFVRAFFFVALGVILDLSIFTDIRFLLISFVGLVALIAARLWAILLAFGRADMPDRDKVAMSFLMPRGLAAAALAAVPFTTYKIVDVNPRTGALGATVDDFIAYAVLILVLTNIVTSVGVYLYENENVRRKVKQRLDTWDDKRLAGAEDRARKSAEREVARLAARAGRKQARRDARASRGAGADQARPKPADAKLPEQEVEDVDHKE